MLIRNSGLLVAGISLLAGWAMLAEADSWDPADNTGPGATVLPINETVQEHGPHTTTSQTDVADWFEVSLTAGTLYHFESTGDADMEAYLYSDSAGSNPVDYNDDISFDDFSFRIDYSPVISSVYYLKVKQRFNASSTYSLKYYADPPASDAWDPDDDTGAGATILGIDEAGRTNGVHVLSSGDTADWFRFSLVAGNTYSFESTGDSDTYAILSSDSDGTPVVSSDDQSGVGDNFQITYKPTVSADYFLKVETPTPGLYASYVLNYIIIEDQWDPVDDTGSGATLLSVSESLSSHGPHTLSATDTNDWFRFSLVAWHTYHFETTVAAPDDQDTRGVLYSDSAGAVQVASDDDSGEVDNFLIVYMPSVSGDYYLKVDELYGNDAGYQLKYSRGTDADADADGDGMLDPWEVLYFGSTNALPDAYGDSDPLSNLEEFIAGTDPTNSASFFAVTNWSAGSFVVGWPSVAGRQYRVFWTDNLTNDFVQTGPLVIDYPQNSYTDTTHNAESSGYYKVDVQLK